MLRRLAGNAHIIKLEDVIYDKSTKRLALAFELMDMSLSKFLRIQGKLSE